MIDRPFHNTKLSQSYTSLSVRSIVLQGCEWSISVTRMAWKTLTEIKPLQHAPFQKSSETRVWSKYISHLPKKSSVKSLKKKYFY